MLVDNERKKDHGKEKGRRPEAGMAREEDSVDVLSLLLLLLLLVLMLMLLLLAVDVKFRSF